MRMRLLIAVKGSRLRDLILERADQIEEDRAAGEQRFRTRADRDDAETREREESLRSFHGMLRSGTIGGGAIGTVGDLPYIQAPASLGHPRTLDEHFEEGRIGVQRVVRQLRQVAQLLDPEAAYEVNLDDLASLCLLDSARLPRRTGVVGDPLAD